MENNGGLISSNSLKANIERSSWYLIEGRVVHCSSYEIPMIREMIRNGSKIGYELNLGSLSHYINKSLKEE
jgi:hypothetical protein